ncbi:MAG: ABC transporter ATP-binding protein [Lachnospiraceae bacterium]|jgi:ATP-binding cassette subfamily B multidrug efflux pump
MKAPGKPGPQRAGMNDDRKPDSVKGSIKRLFAYISHEKAALFIVVICVILSSATALIGSYLLRPIVNTLSEDFKNIMILSNSEQYKEAFGMCITHLVTGIVKMAVVYAVGVIATYTQSRIMIGISQRAILNIRNDLYNKIQSLPIRFFDERNTGEIMSRFTNDIDSVGEMLNNSITQLISGTITIVGTLALMIYTNWILTIITIVFIPLMLKAVATIAKRSRRFFRAQQAALGALNGYIEETVTGQKVVKVFCHEKKVTEEFKELNTELRNKQIKAQFFGGIMGPVMGNLSQISYAVVGAVGGVLCIVSNFDIGGITVFANFSRQFSRPINELSMQVNTIFSALAGAERVFAILDMEPETADVNDVIDMNEKDIQGAVVFDNVTFGYNPDKTVLKNITLYAKPGQKIAFVGSTGAGKTTITNLLNRFYDIEEGTIAIDGHDIKDYSRNSLRQNIAMVLQDTHLFTGTVRENIRYGRLDATDEEVESAAKTASAHSFIMRLENGYDTMIEGDGDNLSQGQRQLLNIARAAISKAPILVLDEATSSVDTRTEKHIEHGMDRLMKSRTTFVIAHRLSTVRNANAIMVLENGEIIERGTHEELLSKKGRYYKLYTGMLELN